MRHLLALDRLGIIELRPLNRYRLKVDKTFRWRADGPVMDFFRSQVVGDYFGGGFDDVAETLMLVHGQIEQRQAAVFVERLQRLGQDFAQQHVADQRLPAERKRAYTLVLAMRSWLFSAFRDLKRVAGGLSAARSAAAHSVTAVLASSMTRPIVKKPWIWRSKQTYCAALPAAESASAYCRPSSRSGS